jgi:copper(I)-binding protein
MRATKIARCAAIAGLAAVAPLAGAAPALSVEGCWIRALPDQGAAYFKLHNDGNIEQRLTAVQVNGYGTAMLHRTQEVGGMMKMTAADNIPVPAHGELDFAPGAYHVMLMGANNAPAVGASTSMTLHFKDGSSLKTDCVVKGPAATGPN